MKEFQDIANYYVRAIPEPSRISRPRLRFEILKNSCPAPGVHIDEKGYDLVRRYTDQLEQRLFKKAETDAEDDTEGEPAGAGAGTYTESSAAPRHAKAHQE